MIHRVYLDGAIRKRLGDIVALQTSLLSYAASHTALDQRACAGHLERDPAFRGRGQAIAAWLWRSKERVDPLGRFANGPPDGKRFLARRVRREAVQFLRCPRATVSPWPDRPAQWEAGAADFLKQFYEELLRGNGLPACAFSDQASGAFSHKDFLKAFMRRNTRLLICAVCDESAYVTRTLRNIRGEIDHFFSQSRYPHLSCHPFNLVPMCNLCNGKIKLARDPLEFAGARHFVAEIFAPYREDGLGTRAYLEVVCASTALQWQLGGIRARSGQELRKIPASLESTYEIPSRWQASLTTIGEELFRRIMPIVQRTIFSSNRAVQMQEMRGALDSLIGELYQNQGTTPWAFAMTWLLARLVNEQIEPVLAGHRQSSSFWDVLQGWIGRTTAPGRQGHPFPDEDLGGSIRREVR